MLEDIAAEEVERVLIVDDDMLSRHMLNMLLTRAGHLIVGKASNGEEAIRQVARCSPTLVLLDLDMTRMEGLVTLRQLHSQFPWLAVLVISMLDASIYGFRCMRLGAKGFLSKSEDIGLLSGVIKQIRHGKMMFPYTASNACDALIGLSDAELVALRCLVRGGDVDNAAMALQITRGHANVVIRRLQAKLVLENHEALIEFGRKMYLN
ncbi:response regulator [Pseudomonas laurylsulfatiphila]|uniref:response regulator n=1 Tax=Pseudomonas laurylsulfatiphila TaxID=2011015 RepID=UPI00215E2B63|nr:response regulator transcription factor [Pseudomonas laurylsulfatiphila]UVM05738.1 response regulator transcription factor [Pseudomonas laurylsulfatiphila]